MNRTHLITLELREAGDALSGKACDAQGTCREFSGRLGLMHTIDELLAAGTTKEPRDRGRPLRRDPERREPRP